MQQLDADRERYLAYLDALPFCISHGDGDRRNLLYRSAREGEAEVVAIDWALPGRSVFGDDSQNIVNGSVVWGQFDVDEIEELDEVAFSGYIAGLREAGWEGDERQIRLGHVISSALKWGLTIGGWAMVRIFPDPTADQVRFASRILTHAMEHADEADEIMRHASLADTGSSSES